MKAHNMQTLPKAKRSTVTAVPWPVCSRCGLVAFGNVATTMALREPCGGREDTPDADAVRAAGARRLRP